MLWGSFVAEGWLALMPIVFASFTDVGLAFDSSDRTVWHFAQDHGMLLLTDKMTWLLRSSSWVLQISPERML